MHHLVKVIETYIALIKKALKIKGIKCVLLFKNEGKAAGMSSTHLHSQLIATRVMFPHLEQELEESKQYYKKHKRCIYCDYIKEERKSKRFVYENDHFIAITPYASMFPYSVMILPTTHIADFTKMDEDQIFDFAEILKKVLTAIHGLGYGYNFYLHMSKKPYHHFHLEIRPRPNIYAGFELGSGIVINTVSPEQAAKYLRRKILQS
jgi:UDPglucose--hexose-1-phosphate uridylyltransferase